LLHAYSRTTAIAQLREYKQNPYSLFIELA